MDKLSDLPNIGEKLEAQLNQVGIYTFDDLQSLGSKKAWLMIKEIDRFACIHRLLALEGALEEVKKNLLSEEKKRELRDFYNSNKNK